MTKKKENNNFEKRKTKIHHFGSERDIATSMINWKEHCKIKILGEAL